MVGILEQGRAGRPTYSKVCSAGFDVDQGGILQEVLVGEEIRGNRAEGVVEMTKGEDEVREIKINFFLLELIII